MTNPDARIRQACGRSADSAVADRTTALASALRVASVRAAELRRRADGEPNNSRAYLVEALHALDHAHAELLAAQDELNVRADELLRARVEHELEWLRYRDLFEAAPISYLETDLRGNVIEANRRCCELLNISPGQLVDKPLIVFVAHPDRQLFRECLGLLASRSGRTSIGLRLQPRHAREQIVVRAEVAAVDLNMRAQRVLRWALSGAAEDAAATPPYPHPLTTLRLSGRGLRRRRKRVTAPYRVRARK